LSDGNGNCITVPPSVPIIPTNSPSACPCQGAIDELQAEINALVAA
jgi:hypothetical protein